MTTEIKTKTAAEFKDEFARFYYGLYHDMSSDIGMLLLAGIKVPREERWEFLENGLTNIKQNYANKVFNFTMKKSEDNTDKMKKLYEEVDRLDALYGDTFTVTTIEPAQTEVVRIVETDNGW